MKLKLINPDLSTFPSDLQLYLNGAQLFDSSCSPEAQVIYAKKDDGYFIKRSKKDSLAREVAMTRYFHQKGLSAEVLAYFQDDTYDWLVTKKIHGFDCTEDIYMNQPAKLVATLAERLHLLHQENFTSCPVQNHTELMLERAMMTDNEVDESFLKLDGLYEISSVAEARKIVDRFGNELQTDTLLHGDYCLPNVILNDWDFSGFIDIDTGGVGDRHVDLYWGIWSLNFNLGTTKYTERFIDAYGRQLVDKDLLKIVGAVSLFEG